ncbi:MAG: MerR family transcriptional regulator [Giesbergeria sp.]
MSTPPIPPSDAQDAYSIAAVERESGLSKDTLRMWERRYGFPAPARDAQGERVYPAEQVERLRQLRRLIHAGHRPGKIVALGADELAALLSAAAVRPVAAGSRLGRSAHSVPTGALQGLLVAQCLDLIAEHDVAALREQLARAVLALGLQACVLQLVAPLTREVGLAWLQGRFQVFEEHLYTECVTGVLRGAIASVPAAAAQGAPRVLLTTFTQEQHGLGLLMLEALLALHGCACLSLGTQTPHADIARAAAVFRADIVALSFSGILPPAQVRAGLRELRAQLGDSTQLWAGGQGAVLAPGEVAGLTVLRPLEAVPQALAEWRSANAPQTLVRR